MSLLTALLRWGHHADYRRGMLHFNRGEYERAADCFESVLAEVRNPADPDHSLSRCYAAEARGRLGLAFFHAGDYGRAETELTRALGENPDFPDLRYYRARVYERSGRSAEAIADLELALRDQPRYVEALLLLAVCRAQHKDHPGSARALERALALGFELPAGMKPARANAWTRSDWARLENAPAKAARPEDRAFELWHAGDLEGAILELTRAVDARPNYADLRARLGGLLIQAGRAAEALTHLDLALVLNPRYLEARQLAARARLERGEPTVAITHLEAAMESHGDYPDLHFWLGLARFRAGDLEGAVAPLERAIELHREFGRAHRLLGLVHHARGRREEALRALRRGLMRDREITRVALEAAPLLPGDRDAEGALRRALAIQPDYPDLHLALARVLRARAAPLEARDAYREALRLAPSLAAATLELAGLELTLGEPRAAAALLEALIVLRPQWADAHALLGRARLLEDDAAAAERSLGEAVRLHAGFVAAWADLGWARLRLGRADEADEAFRRALDLDPLDALPRRQLEWRESFAIAAGA